MAAASRVRSVGARRSKAAAAKAQPESAAPAKNPDKPQAKPSAMRPSALVQKVYKTIDSELSKLERQDGLKSQDRERASRALSQMVTALEKAIDMQREMTKRRSPGGSDKTKDALAHAEHLRREIAERLERLGRKRPAQRSSE